MTRNFLCGCLYLLALLPTLLLPTEEVETQDLSNLETMPTALVDGCVNVITGAFCLAETDLVIPGANPHVLQRHYCSQEITPSHIGIGWSFPFHSYLIDQGKKKDGQEKYESLALSNGKTTELEFFKKFNHKKGVSRYVLSDKIWERSTVNNSSGQISARTNMRHTFVECLLPQVKTLVSGSNKRAYYNYYASPKITGLYVLDLIVMPNRSRVKYEFKKENEEGFPLVKTIQLLDSCMHPVTAFNFDYYKAGIMAMAQDGRQIHYDFNSQTKTLAKMTCDWGAVIAYSYEKYSLKNEKKAYLLTKRDCGDGRYTNIDYYVQGNNATSGLQVVCQAKDETIGRVKFLQAPLGIDATPINKYTFLYNTSTVNYNGKKVPGAGHTIVYNAVGQRTDYFYNDDLRLTEIKHRYADGRLMARQRLFWGAGPERSFLVTHTFENDQRWIQYAKHYVYNTSGEDSDGNVQTEYLLGNLTGTNQRPLRVADNGMIDLDSCECYAKSYTYTEGYYNLPNSESDGTIRTLFSYLPDSDLLESKYKHAHGKLIERQFFSYDDHHHLYQVIIDDGVSYERESLAGVTERREKYYYLNTYGLPTAEYDYYYDGESGEKKLNRLTQNFYNSFQKITRQEIYGADQQLAFTLAWDYDKRGNIIYERNAMGQETFRDYDSQGNCTYESSRPGVYTLHSYDLMNRLLCSKEIHADGIHFVTTHRYDYLGNRIATIDPYGNETLFHYDEFSRLVSVVFPSVLDHQDRVYQPVKYTTYDAFGRPAKETDTQGGATAYEYTVRNQPCYTRYPDGTFETRAYSLDGHLTERHTKEGLRIRYVNDALGRPLSETGYDDEGNALYTRSATYNTFHKLSDTDPSGLTTLYTYYANGLLKTEKTGEKTTEYVYDKLQRLHKTIIKADQDAIVRIQEYDVLDRLIEERLEDGIGTVQKKIQYAYDEGGNRTLSITWTNTGLAIERRRYNSRNELIEIIDPEGHKTLIQIAYDFRNSQGQCVPCRETIDAKGNRTSEQFDALHRLVKKERHSPYSLLQCQHFRYNPADQLVFRQDDRLFPSMQEPVIISWEYDCMGRVIEQNDAANTQIKRTTRYVYDSRGHLVETHKPNGTILYQTYDPLGRLEELHSSDRTIAYRYTYDTLDRLVESHDLLNGAATKRTYNQQGRLQSETLANGHQVHFTYDLAGRPTTFLLPDGCAVVYHYQGAVLKTVEKRNREDALIYQHTYDTHDLTGRIDTETLIGRAGKRKTVTDLNGRTTHIQSDAWQQAEVVYDPIASILHKTIVDSLGAIASSYEYDDTEQMTEETGFSRHSYVNDARYNRCAKDGISYDIDALNQLLFDGIQFYTYDKAGRLLSNGVAAFTYDALDRLVSYTRNGVTTQYTYDAQGRRMSKGEDTFLYQGDHEIGRLTAAGAMVEFRALGIGLAADICAAVAIELEGQIYAPHYDSHGNLTCLVEADSGRISETYRYGAFAQANASQKSPWRLSSKRVDPESGLVFFGKRYYCPSLGRWLTPDPTGYESGPNLYTYVNNSPLIHYDAMGLTAQQNWGSQFLKCLNPFEAIKVVGSLTSWLGHNVCVLPVLKDVIKIGGMILSGESIKGYTPDWMDHSRVYHIPGSHPSPEGHKGVSINGICNSYEEAINAGHTMSQQLGGWDVDVIYNGSHGLFMDCLETMYQYFGGITHADRITRDYFCKESLNQDGKGIYVVSAHSQGGGILSNTARWASNFFRQHVVGHYFGAAWIGQKEHFKEMKAYIAPCDFVCLLGLGGYVRESAKNPSTIEILHSQGCPFGQHCKTSPCYRMAMEESNRNIRRRYL